MKIGSKYELEEIFPRHWEKLCEEIGYSYKIIKDLINNYAEQILTIAKIEREILIKAGKHIPIIDKIIQVIETNVNRTLARFKE